MPDLSKGLFVENQGVLIPWGITNKQAWTIGKPAPWNLPEDRTRIKWDPAVTLDGLECVILAWFPTKIARLSELTILDAHHEDRAPAVWGEMLRTRCDRLFGPGTDERSWHQGQVTLDLMYTDRFVEAYTLEIKMQISPAEDRPSGLRSALAGLKSWISRRG